MRVTTIGDVAIVNPTMPRSKLTEPTKPVSFVPKSAVSERGHLEIEEERPIKEVAKGFTNFERGDVLLAKITPCMENGKAAYLDRLKHSLGFGSTEFHVLRPGPEIYGRYLFYLVWNPRFRFIAETNMTGSAGQKRVPVDFVRKFRIPLPCLADQKRIAAILDKADAIRRKHERLMELGAQLPLSLYADLFGNPITNDRGWTHSIIGDHATISSGATPSKSEPHFWEGRIPWVSPKDMKQPYIADSQDHINEQAVQSSGLHVLPSS